ncbi:MAG: hypothetical protein Kow0027_18110 [Saprospiraceae bacterium]
MKRALLLWACIGSICVQAQQTHLEFYGTEQIDINQGHDLLQVNDSTFIIGGEWNNAGYLALVDQAGQLLDYFFLDGTIPGNSRVLDLEQDLAGNIIAAGECDHCVTGDTTNRIFAVAVEPNLLFINSAIYEGSELSNKQIAEPSIARKGNQLVLAASQGGTGLNFSDLRLIGITSNLNVSWSKVYNSCGNCGFDQPLGISTTLNGFGVLVRNAFTDSVTLYALNDTGAVLLKKRLPEPAGTQFLGLDYRLGTFYAFGYQTPAGGNKEGTIWRIGETDGSIISTFPVAFPSVNDEIVATRFASDNLLLAVSQRAEPNSLGTYTVSGMFRVNAINGTINGFTEIPNPDVFTNMSATAVVPLDIEGTELAATGSRGFYSRTFFFSVTGDQPQPPGVAFTASPDTACGPALVFLNNYLTGATSYQWFLDGVQFSEEMNPAPLTISEGGLHEISLQATVATENKIQNFVVSSLPEIWNECIICDNKPDPYVVIKTVAGGVLYTSGWVESYPPVALPVSFSMDVSQTYILEVWDKDNIGADDFFGAFTIEGNSAGGTFSVTNPGDPAHPLTISFSMQLQTQQSTHTQTVLVYQPSANLQGGTLLVADPGNPAPPSYSWQWFYNGELIPGATSDTLTPTLGGNYVVAMMTPECTALSEPVQFVTPLTGLQVDVVQPKCPGDANGEIHVQPIGGIGPYTYGWKPPILTGSDPTGLAAGTYNLTVTDANGQTANTTIVLTDPDSLLLNLEPHDLACHADQSGYIVVNASGGTGDYSYTWSDSTVQGPNPIYLSAGLYSVTVTDQNGCTVVDSTELSEPPPLELSLSFSPFISSQTLGSATAEVSGGTPPYSYLWSDSLAQTTATAEELLAGTYTVTVTDANGCPIVDSVEVKMVYSARESELLKGLSLYPNPLDEVIFFNGAGQVPGPVSISLSSASGQRIENWDLPAMPQQLVLTDMAPGMYFLRITATDGQRTWKLVKR